MSQAIYNSNYFNFHELVISNLPCILYGDSLDHHTKPDRWCWTQHNENMEFWNPHPTFYHQETFLAFSWFLWRQTQIQQHLCNCILWMEHCQCSKLHLKILNILVYITYYLMIITNPDMDICNHTMELQEWVYEQVHQAVDTF